MTGETLTYCPDCNMAEGEHATACRFYVEGVRVKVWEKGPGRDWRYPLIPVPTMAPRPQDFHSYNEFMAASRAWDFENKPMTPAQLVDVLEEGGYKAMAATIKAAFEK